MKRPALLLILAVAATAAAAEDEEVIVACSLATSFYERAPTDIADAMYIAVGNACADSDHQPAWLCDGRSLTFYRGVYANDEKSRSGFVCLAETMSAPRYARTDIHAQACVVANEDEPGSYEVSVMEEEEEGSVGKGSSSSDSLLTEALTRRVRLSAANGEAMAAVPAGAFVRAS